MKLGLENRREVAMMVLLFLVGTASVYYTFFREEPQPEVSARPKTTTAKTQVRRVAGAKMRKGFFQLDTQTLDPTLRLDWLSLSEDREYEGGKRNLFASVAEAEDAKEPPCHGKIDPKTHICVEEAVNTGPVTPPAYVPPPINLKFYGFASKPGQPRRIFLSQGEDVFVASEGEIVGRRYKVIKINSGSVEIEDVLNNNKQTIPLTQG
ncbi:MAG: hypothetical protein HYX26_04185 [Acidobacteriales bacterium]|nr:hypothetical protein [Terriglobales bacterium]